MSAISQNIPDTMRAAAIDRFGEEDQIHLHQQPVPQVDADEILIHVEAAGVGVWDPYERQGGFARMSPAKPSFPYVLGSEGAGTVMAVGSQVTGFQRGDRVYASCLTNPKGGFYAEYAAVKADDASPIPGNLTIEQAGAMPIDAITALRGLHETLALDEGESVLIFGASGGVGHLAVQLAKRMDLHVLAVASGADGVALVERLGADMTIDGHSENITEAARRFAPDGVDAALITAHSKGVDEALAAVRDEGRVAFPHGVEPEPKARPGVSVQGYDGSPDANTIAKLNRLIEAGPFEVHIARTFTLDHAADAHRALAEHYVGKLALRPAA